MFTPDKIFAAPLAGITDLPYRRILRKCAPDAALLTEMISCHSLVGGHKNCLRNFDNYGDEGLIGAQIFGAEPKLMGEAAKILESNGAKWIDINMGCPVPKVATRAGAGAFLMRDHKLASEIIKNVISAVKIPVSIKTRLGWDAQNMDSADLIRIAADLGVSFATIHGRTRAAGYAGNADWNAIKKIKDVSKIPIIFNGDIKNMDDVLAVEKLGADGAMIGRAILGNPMLLGELTGANTKYSVRDLILEHLDSAIKYYGEKTAIPMFRKHAAWYSAGMQNANNFRIRVNSITNAKELEKEIKNFYDI